MVNILFLGHDDSYSTSTHRANALKRLGHTVVIKDPYSTFAHVLESRLLGALHYQTGYRLLQTKMLGWLEQIKKQVPKPDVVWVDHGELFGVKCLAALKQLRVPVLLYNVDDPTGNRESRRRFGSLLEALPMYDLVVVVRRETEEECRALGAKRVMRVFRSYDEIAHQPFPHRSQIRAAFRSEVAFIGTWMRNENRDKFLLELIRQKIQVSIWGDRWPKSPHFSEIKPYWRGSALGGRDYAAAIQGAKVCLGLLCKANRDLHTNRSLEVPFAGGLLCAERTTEHVDMFREGTEAVFWSDAAECAEICRELIKNDARREEIRLAGMRRVRELGAGNEDVCKTILDAVFNST